MFWGLVLKANKKYSQTVQKAFHLSQAALDLTKCGDADVQVMLTSEESTYLLCTLGKKTPQVALDLNFDEGDQISLSTKGEGVVHLTGYLMPNEEDLFGGEDDEDLEEEEDEEVEASPQKGKGKQERIAKKVAQKVNAKEVQEDEGDEDELDETFELPKGANKKPGAKGAEEEEDSDDDDDDEDDEDDEDDDEELEESKLDGEEEESDDDDEDDDDEDDDDEEDESEDEQPKAKVAKLDKKAPKQNGVENGKATQKEQKKEGQQQEGKSRTLQGGLVVEDLKVGSGQEAKPGKKLAVYYEGRLKKNNKVFDSTNRGPGFKFALGRGEVIKGWDLGVSGMKVGGKRRLTVPHQLAYGTRGSPPVIPPNSTLVFDVELKNVF